MNKGERVLAMRAAGLSNKEIAGALNMPVPSVRRLASEAKPATATLEEAMAWGAKFEAAAQRPNQFDSLRRSIGLDRRLATRKKPIKHFFLPDPQCQPGDTFDHLEWMGEYCAEQAPDVIINAGDHWDMGSLSSYEQKGSKYFEGRRYRADIKAGNAGLDAFERGLAKGAEAGWKPRKVMLRGNHEDRISRAINSDPRLEGVLGFHDFNDVAHGWEVHDFLVPVEIDSLTYAHFFVNPGNGRPYSGNVETMIKNVGFSFVQGHQQGLRWGRRELGNGKVQIGLIAGSSYLHAEAYRGPQAKSEWRGVCVLHEVADGGYDPMFVSVDYLHRKYAK